MAEEEGVASANELPANGEDTLPQIGVISQYVKDLSFENPNAPAVYQWQTQPSIDVQFNFAAERVGEDVYESTLHVQITAKTEDRTAFAVELAYAGLFGLRNFPEEQLQPFLLAEAPRILFPFARRIISDATRDGGFPPLMLDPIDFGAIYMQRLAQHEAEQALNAGDEAGNA